MKVIALNPFTDKKEGVARKLGDAFIISKERFEEINSTAHGILVKEIKEAKSKKKTSKKQVN